MQKARERFGDSRLEPSAKRVQKSLQNGPVERLAHGRDELEVHLRGLPEALQLASIDFVDGLDARQHGFVAARHADIAKQKRAVEPAMGDESKLFGGGMGMGVGVERRGRELNAVGDEALFDVEPRCDFFVGGGE